MKYLLILIFSGFILHSCAPKAKEENKQPVAVVNFDQLEPRLQKQNDTIYIVNFWATWCKPCVHELPDFEKLAL